MSLLLFICLYHLVKLKLDKSEINANIIISAAKLLPRSVHAVFTNVCNSCNSHNRHLRLSYNGCTDGNSQFTSHTIFAWIRFVSSFPKEWINIFKIPSPLLINYITFSTFFISMTELRFWNGTNRTQRILRSKVRLTTLQRYQIFELSSNNANYNWKKKISENETNQINI